MHRLWAGRLPRYILSARGGSLGASGMIKSKNLVAALRRDATFVGRAVVAIVFTGFAAIVVTAALYDLFAIRH